LSENVSEIIEKIRALDPEAVIEAVEPKSNVPNSLGLYITIAKSKTAKQIREQIDEIKGIRFSISD